MRPDKKISAGDLAVCAFSTLGGPAWLALLKMDQQSGLVGEMGDIDGKKQMQLRRVDDIVPATKLQKCAFIIPASERGTESRDLQVLDEQSSRFYTSRPAASF